MCSPGRRDGDVPAGDALASEWREAMHGRHTIERPNVAPEHLIEAAQFHVELRGKLLEHDVRGRGRSSISALNASP